MNYLNPKVEVRDTPDKGRGLFALEKISKGETIEKTTDGIQVLTKAQIAAKPDAPLWKSLCYEIGGDKEECPIDMRDIEAGEELTYDYAMTDSGNYDMACKCGSLNCRVRVKGSDWMNPELQERYKGFFAKNIQEKIDILHP